MSPVSKLLSGRFWLTILIGLTFCYCAVYDKLSSENIMEIILIVMYGYFTKRRNENGQ